MTLIELKKQVTFGKWPQIKQQWHGAWLHALAIAGVLEISLTEKVQCVVGYRTEKLGQNNPDPILLKAHSGSQSTLREWETNSAELHELGQVQFMPVQLDENGYGEVAI